MCRWDTCGVTLGLLLFTLILLVVEEEPPLQASSEEEKPPNTTSLGAFRGMPARWDPVFVKVDANTQWECACLDACAQNSRIWSIATPYGRVAWANTSCRSGVSFQEFAGLSIVRLPNWDRATLDKLIDESAMKVRSGCRRVDYGPYKGNMQKVVQAGPVLTALTGMSSVGIDLWRWGSQSGVHLSIIIAGAYAFGLLMVSSGI